MKMLLASVALFVLSGSRADKVKLAFAPEEGTSLKRTFDADAEYKLSDLVYSVDGEPLDTGGETPSFSMHFKEHIAVTDELTAVAEGRPTELVRRFDELSQETTASANGEEQGSSSSGSALEGRSVRFTWDKDDEGYHVAAGDDEELDEDVSAGLVEDMDLRGVLPPDEVEVGDEWELDPKLYLAFMWPSGLLEFHDEGEEVRAEDRSMNQETIDRLEGTGTARLEELREEDGRVLAVIHVELQISTGCDSVQESEEGDSVTVEVEIERKLTGSILWDVEHGHAHSADLEAEASRQTTRTGKVESEKGEVELEESELLEGTIHYVATIERS